MTGDDRELVSHPRPAAPFWDLLPQKQATPLRISSICGLSNHTSCGTSDRKAHVRERCPGKVVTLAILIERRVYFCLPWWIDQIELPRRIVPFVELLQLNRQLLSSLRKPEPKQEEREEEEGKEEEEENKQNKKRSAEPTTSSVVLNTVKRMVKALMNNFHFHFLFT